MNQYDVIVIGGGLLGCFTLRALTQYKLSAALLEAREDVCTGISRANTAIVYSGCDTKPGTLKSALCVRSAQRFDTLCRELGVRYSPCGTLMVSFGPKGDETLRRKHSQGLQNGVQGVRLLSGDEVLKLEPNLNPRVTSGLYAPEAGTVNPWELGMAAAENARKNGADLLFNHKVTAIKRTGGGYIIDAGGKTFEANGIINCAGLFADDVFELVSEPLVRIYPVSGDYFVLDTKASGYINHVIFHEPEEKSKGLTLVPTVDGNILVGPSKVSAAGKDDAFPTSAEGLEHLRRLVGDVIPPLPMQHVIRSFGAMRPNPFFVQTDENGVLTRGDKGISDFFVHESDENPNFISLIGIKTPGLTCASELGQHVAARLVERLGFNERNASFDPHRSAPIRVSECAMEERAQLAAENPAYGAVVCRCRGVTEAEIINSIRQQPGAVTVDGVKRRTGAGSGRCQGGFCMQRIIEILSRELGRPPTDIQKDRPGSAIVRGRQHDGA